MTAPRDTGHAAASIGPAVPVAISWARTVPAASLAPAGSDRARVDRPARGADRDRSASAGVLLRVAVARWTGAAGEDVALRSACALCGATDHGKPFVAVTPAVPNPPQVSVAHAGDVVVVAVTDAGPVGVDVEPLEAARFEGVEAVVLSELERTARGATQAGATARTWVRKEAVLKATGLGLAVDPRCFAVSGPDQPARVLTAPPGDDAGCWALEDVELAPGLACAVAVRTGPGRPLAVQVTGLDVGSSTSGGSSVRNSHASNR